jgi:hypothetical protein
MPLWLLPVTPKAFPAIFRALFNATLFMPIFQLLMLITDAIFGKVLQWASTGSFVGIAGAAFVGPLPALGIALGYIVAYLVAVLLLLKNTPKIISAALSGAGAVSAYLGTQAKGLAAGVLTAGGIVAAPAATKAAAVVGGKMAAAAPGLAKAAAARIPAGLRNAGRSIGYKARAAVASLPQPVRSAGASIKAGFSPNFYAKHAPAPAPAASAASVAPAPMPSAPAARSAPPAEKPHESFTSPFMYALKRSAKTVVDTVNE